MGKLTIRKIDLNHAVIDGNVSRVEAILQSRPDMIKTLNEPEKNNGWTQLFRAVHFDQSDSVRVLRKYGARIDVKCGKGNSEGETPIGIAEKGDFDIHIWLGRTPEEMEKLKAEMMNALRCRINPVFKSIKRASIEEVELVLLKYLERGPSPYLPPPHAFSGEVDSELMRRADRNIIKRGEVRVTKGSAFEELTEKGRLRLEAAARKQ